MEWIRDLICDWFGHDTYWVPHVERGFESDRIVPAYELRCKRCKKRLGYITDRHGKFTDQHRQIFRRIPNL